MDKIIPYSKVRAGDEIVHDGKLSLVEKVERGPVYVTLTTDSYIIDRAGFLLTAVRRPVKTRTTRPCPPLTALLTPGERAWVESFAAQLGVKPQELIAAAVRQHRADQEAASVPAPPERKRWWAGRRKR